VYRRIKSLLLGKNYKIISKEEIFMSTLSKEQVKEIIKGNNFQSVADVAHI